MDNTMKVVDKLLDSLKRVLGRFRDAKFGLLFFINIFKLPDFFTDRRVNVISKFRVMFALGTAIIYMVSGIDFIPEMITGLFGFIDDIFVIVWSLGIVSEEVEKYKKLVKDDKDPNVIEDVDFKIYDDKE
ncbi:YkvA family protein [Romboutsia sp.]|uniref:YkvA family protein n=1 Tax=Romboutsia sp. TaxID=1965302 RepID=UPI003F30C99A